LEAASWFARELNEATGAERAAARAADAADPSSLLRCLEGANLLVVCSPTTRHTAQVARIALRAGVDVLDIHYPQGILRSLKKMAPDLEAAGRCFITQAGFHPGLPSAFIRYAAREFTGLRRAVTAIAFRTRDTGSPDSARELVEEFRNYKAEVFQHGAWRVAGYRDAITMNFGPGFGVRKCYPMTLDELRGLPERFGLAETGAYVTGFNWFTDLVAFPVSLALLRFGEGGTRAAVSLFRWSIKTFSRPPSGVVFILSADGKHDGRNRELRIVARHPNGYFFTAAPVVACILQYLDGSIRKPGLWYMGHLVDPVRLVHDLRRLGVQVDSEIRDAGQSARPST
jgi:saccharopine dehydrogenase (NAD+, L-lysine-forming)